MKGDNIKQMRQMFIANISENRGSIMKNIASNKGDKMAESNLLLSMPSNHILNGLNGNLTTTNITSQLLATTPLELLQLQGSSLSILPLNSLHHRLHSLNLVVLPYNYQEGVNQNCHRQSFYRDERRLNK